MDQDAGLAARHVARDRDDVVPGDLGHLRGPLRRVHGHAAFKLLQAVGVGPDVVLVVFLPFEEEMDPCQQQRGVRTGTDREPSVRLASGHGHAWVNDNQVGPVVQRVSELGHLPRLDVLADVAPQQDNHQAPGHVVPLR